MKNLQNGKRNAGKLHSWQKAAIAIIAIAAVALSVWYHIPLKKDTSITVINSKDSESYVNVRLDLDIYRSFLFPTEIRGQLQFGDVTYIPWAKEEFGFFKIISKKIKGDIVSPVCINSSNIGHIGTEELAGIGHDRMLSDLIYIQYLEFDRHYNVKALTLFRICDGSSIWNSSE